MFDDMVSCLRTYSVEELRDLTDGLGARNYHWEVGEVKGTAGPFPLTYLVGVPL